MRRYTLTVDGTPFVVDVEETAADRFVVTVGDLIFEAALEVAEDLPGTLITPGMPGPHAVASVPHPAVPPHLPAASVRPVAVAVGGAASGSRDAVVSAPMPGVVLEVLAAAGATVRRGDPLLVLEAMKMRNTIRSPREGVVLEVSVEAGRPVVPGEPLVRLGDAAS